MATLLRSSLQAMLTCSLPDTLTHTLYRYVYHNLTFLTTRILLNCTRSTVCLITAPREVGIVKGLTTARVAVVATGATKARVASAAAVAAVAAVAAIAAVAIKARVAAEAAVAAVAAV